jgi:hypothetical protein
MRRLLIAGGLLLAACVGGRPDASRDGLPARAQTFRLDSGFAQLIEQLSEPGAYFDTDNLISNERSYLHVMGALERPGGRGGAYLGVGPDQNFSYIAAVRPDIAFIVDIRRENMLQHLMFKALFSLARNRMEYLCLLHGRTMPADDSAWTERPVEELVAYVDSVGAARETAAASRNAVLRTVQTFGVPLSDEDLRTIGDFHGRFVQAGLGLRFQSHGRVPLPHYPTYRELLLERDLAGNRASYVASERAFQRVKLLQAQDRIIPVVGDFAGDHSLAAIGALLSRRGEKVTAFYPSNVEYYLMRGGGFERFVANVGRLPHDDRSMIIRSFFGRNFGFVHPQTVPGYYTVQLLQSTRRFLRDQTEGTYRSYLDLVTRDVIELR